MTLRFKLGLAIAATGALTALLVIAAVLQGYQRFDRELGFRRATAFLDRIVARHGDLLDQRERDPEAVGALLRSLLLYEPQAQLYLLDAQGRVMAGTADGVPALQPVALSPVIAAAAVRPDAGAMYVMGDDPERGAAGAGAAVIAARALDRATIRRQREAAGYLYLVCPPQLLTAAGWWPALKAGFALPATWLVVAILALATGLAVWLVVSVTRPLLRLSVAVADVAPEPGGEFAPLPATLTGRSDEIGQLGQAFERLLARVHAQWTALKTLDHFRREAVSNLSHDLRSPLTATAACLETLETRWSQAPAQADATDRELLAVARRNTHNAARLVQSLGDLAQLEEPAFRLRPQRVDLRELLDDVALRFAERAQAAGVAIDVVPAAQAIPATLDIELVERALANLIDNALQHARAGDRVALEAWIDADSRLRLTVADTGPGVPEAEVSQLFERYVQGHAAARPKAGGKGLGLAIVKRIAELHGGSAVAHSTPGSGLRVSLDWPAG